MDVQSEHAVDRRIIRRSACDLCREYKVKCSGSRSKCDRCTRLGKDCVFSAPRNRHPQGQDGRSSTWQRASFQDRFIHINPEVFRARADNAAQQAARKEQASRSHDDEQFDNDHSANTTTSWLGSTSPHHPTMAPSTSESRPPSSQIALSYNSSRPRDRASSAASRGVGPHTADDTWYWDSIADFGDHLTSSDGTDIPLIAPDELSAMAMWGDDSGGSHHDNKSEQRSITGETHAVAVAAPHAISVSALRPRSALKRTEPRNHHPHAPAVAAAPSNPCTCIQQLTVNLFELSTWRADQPMEDGTVADPVCPSLSEFLIIFRNCTDLWKKLTRECAGCLSEPHFAQLLILNIEQLANLQRNQLSWRQHTPLPFPADTISIGNFVVDIEQDRANIIGMMLRDRTNKFIDCIEALQDLFLPTSMGDIRARFEMVTDKLKQFSRRPSLES